ncbi:MAG: glutamate 5-kinase [Ruminococcaceae bacterium]|nr:glutamate 5-kinase [Oscillospiraceae bacterium]
MDIVTKDREAEYRAKLTKAHKVVIKIGTSSLMYESGGINLKRIHKLAEIISDMMNEGRDVILVSSGAIGVGVKMLRLSEKPKTVEGRQAVAAVGQVDLMKLYSMAFADYGYSVGQILLTKNILDNGESKKHSVNTFSQLLKMRIVPIVNENDTVAVDEIKFGDNDSLSYMVATINNADLLIILTDIDGFYSNNPNEDPDAVLYHTIEDLSEKIEEAAGGAGSKLGTGGMLTKVHASRLAASMGTDAVIANGDHPEIIYDILDGKDVGTLFVAQGKDEK